ncbi:MAG: CPBP family glutamic-type intramembrane protease [Paracoccaceae bacterium]
MEGRGAPSGSGAEGLHERTRAPASVDPGSSKVEDEMLIAQNRTGAITAALCLWAIWTFATWWFEGRIGTFARPDAVADRLIYTGVVNVVIGIIGGALTLRYLLRNGVLAKREAGLGEPARTLLWVLVAFALGLAAYFGQGAPSSDAIVILNAFSQVLVVSMAEVVVCWGVVGGVLASTISDRNWLNIPAAALGASVLFGVYHFAHSAPFNTIGMVGFLTVIGLLTSVVFFVSRDVYATIVFHNFLGVFGVLDAMAAQDKLAAFQVLQWPLIGTAAMALAVLVLVQILIIRRPS